MLLVEKNITSKKMTTVYTAAAPQPCATAPTTTVCVMAAATCAPPCTPQGSVFGKIWFWLLVLSVIILIIAAYFFERDGQLRNGTTSTPLWIWIMFGLGALIFIAAFIMYIIDYQRHKKPACVDPCAPCVPECAPVCAPPTPVCAPPPVCAPVCTPAPPPVCTPAPRLVCSPVRVAPVYTATPCAQPVIGTLPVVYGNQSQSQVQIQNGPTVTNYSQAAAPIVVTQGGNYRQMQNQEQSQMGGNGQQSQSQMQSQSSADSGVRPVRRATFANTGYPDSTITVFGQGVGVTTPDPRSSTTYVTPGLMSYNGAGPIMGR